MSDRVGQQFGNYRLVALLGQGGYAEVYLGQHVRFNQQAAIKVLHAHLSGVEAEHFQQEAETIATLAHPSIIRVLDFDVQEGVPFLVIDYASGGTLRRRYPKGSLVPLPVIVSSVKQVAAALQYAHEQKFIHRDVKPENMLVGRHQEVLLSDFGIATIMQSTSSLSASAEGTSGTLAYMAPEQIQGHPRPASDQYALGVVVYEWLCGERPFEGSVSELLAQRHALDVYDLDIGDADETERRAQVRFLEIEGLHRSLRIGPSSCQDEHGLLSRHQALRPLFGITERAPRAHDVIDPCLERRGDAEIVHGRRDDDDVRGEELRDQRVGKRQRLPIRVALLLGRNSASGSERRADVRQRLPRYVAHDHARFGIAGLEIVDDPARDPVRIRLPAARAARNEQNVFHRGLLELRAARAAESSSVLDDSFMYHLREKKGRRNG